MCGMTVDRDLALHSRHRGRDYFFCSPGCQHTFEQHPDAYAAASAGAAGH